MMTICVVFCVTRSDLKECHSYDELTPWNMSIERILQVCVCVCACACACVCREILQVLQGFLACADIIISCVPVCG